MAGVDYAPRGHGVAVSTLTTQSVCQRCDMQVAAADTECAICAAVFHVGRRGRDVDHTLEVPVPLCYIVLLYTRVLVDGYIDHGYVHFGLKNSLPSGGASCTQCASRS